MLIYSDELKDLVVETQRINELSNKVDDLYLESLISYKLINLNYTETKNGRLIQAEMWLNIRQAKF